MLSAIPSYTIGDLVNKPNSDLPFELIRFETIEEPDVEEVHKHLFYEVLWIDAGSSKQVIDYNEYELTPQTLFFISPGQVHSFEEWRDVKGGCVFFTEGFFLLNSRNTDMLFELSFLDNFYADPALNLSDTDFAQIRQTIHLLEEEHQRVDASDVILQSLLHILLAQVQRCVDARLAETPSKRYVVIYKQFKRLLDEHFAKGRTAIEYAEELNITPHHLNFVTKQTCGKTATEVIRGRSLLEAKRLLTFTDLSISDVAGELGFFDSSYFAKVFRQEEGISPIQFRQTMSEKYRKKSTSF